MSRRWSVLPLVVGALFVAAPVAAQAAPHYLLTVKSPAAHAAVAVTPQGLSHGLSCGTYVGFATGHNPDSATTTNQTQVYGRVFQNIGTLVTTVCQDSLPVGATKPGTTEAVIGLCAQFNPYAAAGTPLVGGTAITVVYPDGSYSATCRSVLPSIIQGTPVTPVTP
jgi:hypothetical protein